MHLGCCLVSAAFSPAPHFQKRYKNIHLILYLFKNQHLHIYFRVIFNTGLASLLGLGVQNGGMRPALL